MADYDDAKLLNKSMDEKEAGAAVFALLLDGSSMTVAVCGHVLPVIILLTVVNNLIVCVVLLRRKMRNATNVVLVGMAVADTLTGLLPLPHYVHFYTTGLHRDWVPYNWCITFSALTDHLPTAFHTASIWLTVTLAFHRYVYVCHSVSGKSKWMVSATKMTYVVLTIFAVAVISQLSRLVELRYSAISVPSLVIGRTPPSQHSYLLNSTVTSGYADSPGTVPLVVGCLVQRRQWFHGNRHVYFAVYFWCRVVIVHLVPCSALIVFNVLLVRAMRRAHRRRTHLLAINMRRNECRRLADSNLTTLMLVVVVGLFLLVEFPLAVLFILLIVKHTFRLTVLDDSAEQTASLVINTCILLSYPINFFVYCRMSRKFRQTFAELFCRQAPVQDRTTVNEERRPSVGPAPVDTAPCPQAPNSTSHL